jgi:methylglyoxal synthase
MMLLSRGTRSMAKIAMIRHKKRIALIAHDNKKEAMLEWTKYNIAKTISVSCQITIVIGNG